MNHPAQASDSIRRLAVRWRQGLAAWLGTTLAATLLVGAAAAQVSAEAPIDPPGRVGRMSDVVGQVQFYSPSLGEWAPAVRNRPVTDGDRIATEASGRAELRIGSTTLRLDSASELEVLRIDDARMELQLHNGTVSVRLRNREAADEFELRTGEGRFRAQRPGRYRIDRIDEASHLTVSSGAMVYEGPGSALTVYSGQRAEFWLDRANAAQYSVTEPKRDAFAAWNAERDRQDDRSASTRYVSPEMTGVEDLDRHGRWESSDDYGPIWVPRAVPAGWAPYSTGHWIWVRPWGWTWVDDAPWGFAPFHYGRWVWFGSRWCWAPGTRVLRPVYAPALVAWVGGPHVSVSVNIGGPTVGWFPLAPREVYVPSYYYSPRYIREVNVTHVTNISNVTVYNQPNAPQRDFSNRKFPHAVTVVPATVMTQRQPVAPAAAQWRERHGHGELVREVTRATPQIAAPVDAPATRTLDSQRITSPGIGTATVVAPPSVRPGIPGRPVDERRDTRRSDDRGGGANGDQIRSATRPGMAAPAIPVVPAAPAVPAVPVVPPRPAMTPTPAPAVAHGTAMPPAVATAPAVQPPRSIPMPDVRPRPERPRGIDVPPTPPRADAVVQPPAARAPSTDRSRAGPAAEPGRAVANPRQQVERPVRERAEPRNETRRDGRGERQQAP